MRIPVLLAVGLLAVPGVCAAQAVPAPAAAPAVTTVVTADIDRFWAAYDAIRATDDIDEQVRILVRQYILPGSPGLYAFMEARGYTPLGYVNAIRRYPKYWDSIRPRTQVIQGFLPELEPALAGLRRIYPGMRPSAVYFTVGVMRSGGTTQGDKVLIGAEVATGDPSVDLSELPESRRAAWTPYFATDPARALDLLVVHEVVHTQQRGGAQSLLAQAVFEGVADFVAERATGRVPELEYMRYGAANAAAVREAFKRDMAGSEYGYWLYSDATNPFGVRDLGYYVGYAISAAYYEKAADKAEAIRAMIELNTGDAAAVQAFVDASGWLTET